jgi:hypothetical protein
VATQPFVTLPASSVFAVPTGVLPNPGKPPAIRILSGSYSTPVSGQKPASPVLPTPGTNVPKLIHGPGSPLAGMST